MPREDQIQQQQPQQKLYQQDLNKSMNVSLGDDQSFEYGLNLDQSMFTMSNMDKTLDQHRSSRKLLRNRISADDKLIHGKIKDLTKEEKLALLNRTEGKLTKKDESSLQKEESSYAERMQMEKELMQSESVLLFNDKKWYQSKDGKEMARVKKTVAALNNLLDSDMKQFYDGENFGIIEAKKLNEIFDKAYEEVINACIAYEEAKHPKHSTGIRRKNKVIRMREICKNDRERFSIGTEALRTSRLTLKPSEVKSPRDLLAVVRCEDEIGLSEIQKEGNSSNVYKVKLAQYDENGKKIENSAETLYLKENLPLLSKNLPGYLDRRIEELERSYELMRSDQPGDYDHSEARMRKFNAQAQDYEIGLAILKKMRDNLEAKKDDPIARDQLLKRYIQFFKHDFDADFINLKKHNEDLKEARGEKQFKYEKQDEIDAIEKEMSIKNEELQKAKAAKKEAEDKKKPKNEIDEFDNKINAIESWIDENNRLLFNLQGFRDVALQNHEAAMRKKKEEYAKKSDKEKAKDKELTGFQWVTEKMDLGLDKSKDKDILDLVKQLDDYKHEAVEHFFRFTTGKEAEMYGQVTIRGGSGEDEVNATHNTIYSIFARRYKFTDVITTSRTALVKFTPAGAKKKRVALCTVTEEAKGEEFLDVRERAEKEGKKVQYTPEAIRQLMRLQSIDTAFLQNDRHGRNFKCQTKTDKDGNIIITSIKSYDHDMSCGEDSLKDALKKGGGKVGFLPGATKKIKKDSPLYNYILKKYLQQRKTGFMAEWDEKEPDTGYTQKYSQDRVKKNKTKLMEKAAAAAEFLGMAKLCMTDQFMNERWKVLQDLKAADDYQDDAITPEAYQENADPKYHVDNFITKDKKKVQVISEAHQKELKEILDFVGDKLFVLKKNEEGEKRVTNRYNHEQYEMKQFAKITKEDRLELVKKLHRLNVLYKQLNFDKIYTQMEEGERKAAKERSDAFNNKTRELAKNLGFDYNYRYEEIDMEKNSDTKNVLFDLKYGIESILKYCTDMVKLDDELKLELLKINLNEGNLDDFPLKADENGDVEIPNLLHYDYEAYQQLKQMEQDFESGDLELEMQEAKLSQKKIDAFRTRVKEEIRMVEDMKAKAEKFFEFMNIPDTKVQGRFFLKKEDYSKITDLSELSFDPSSSYLSIDNPTYLYQDPKFFNETEMQQRKNDLEAYNHDREDPKRMHTTKIEHNEEKDKEYKVLQYNVLSSKIYIEPKESNNENGGSAA